MFNKLFTKILDSSIWLEPVATRIVWITLLAAMDEDGYAHFSAVENLASRARVTVEEATVALECFMAPDPNSGNPANDGRRVERVPGGFMVLNAAYHREAMNRVVQREQTRQRVAAWRADNPEPKKKQQQEKVYSSGSRALLCYLREKTGRPFRETEANLKLIEARLSEPGVEVEGCRKMIDRQVVRWKGTQQEEYLRPETLFGKTKFDGYYAAKDQPINTESEHGNSKTNRGSGSKRGDLNQGTYNEGSGHLYRDAATKPVANIQRPATGNDAGGSTKVPGATLSWG